MSLRVPAPTTMVSNTENPPFDDASVRLAFSEAVDRQSIVENITKSGQLPAGFFSLPNLVAAPTEADYPGRASTPTSMTPKPVGRNT